MERRTYYFLSNWPARSPAVHVSDAAAWSDTAEAQASRAAVPAPGVRCHATCPPSIVAPAVDFHAEGHPAATPHEIIRATAAFFGGTCPWRFAALYGLLGYRGHRARAMGSGRAPGSATIGWWFLHELCGHRARSMGSGRARSPPSQRPVRYSGLVGASRDARAGRGGGAQAAAGARGGAARHACV